MLVEPPALSLSPIGYAAWTPAAWTAKGRPRQLGYARRWAEVVTVAARGGALEVDGVVVHTFPLATTASILADLMERLRAAPEGQRQAILTAARDTATDAEAVRARLAQLEATSRPLRWGGAWLTLVLLVVAPLVLARFGGPLVLVALALAAVVGVAWNIAWFVHAHAGAWPEERWERVETALIMAFNWPLAARAASVLGRHTLAGSHPLAAAMAVDGSASDRFVAWVVRDAMYPLAGQPPSAEAHEIVAWHARRERELVGRLAAARASSAPMSSSDAAAVCPRCLATFARGVAECPDCPGVAPRPTGDRTEPREERT